MPLEILLILVVGGISGIAVILHLLGLTSPRRLRDAEDARAAWLREFPYELPTDITLSADQRAALITTQAGPGLVWCLGADTVSRPLSGSDLSVTKNGLRVDFHDVGAPHARISLPDADRQKWRDLMRTA
ncbi:hypothetical protein [Shimia aestuarii]|uniref:Uncharacterized protein n=1 Tax=Shimia aestuarii TaxID=254406 RepID=A0A1I4HYW3_9RHOB|nr:hypothetical protein [Shimia aestuarii]SFL47017.1 hypothetical protein SAMN04488042_101320 [Shimia aestuarii]